MNRRESKEKLPGDNIKLPPASHVIYPRQRIHGFALLGPRFSSRCQLGQHDAVGLLDLGAEVVQRWNEAVDQRAEDNGPGAEGSVCAQDDAGEVDGHCDPSFVAAEAVPQKDLGGQAGGKLGCDGEKLDLLPFCESLASRQVSDWIIGRCTLC